MIALMSDVTGKVVGAVQKALGKTPHAAGGLMVTPNRPNLSVVPALVTTNMVSAHRDSRKGKLMLWLIDDNSSPATALESGQLISDHTDTHVNLNLTKISSLDLATFKAWIAESPRPKSMQEEISEDAWNDAKKCLLSELTIYHR